MRYFLEVKGIRTFIETLLEFASPVDSLCFWIRKDEKGKWILDRY